MENLQLKMPGYRINEYQLVLHPHQDLRNKINRTREEFFARYKLPIQRTLMANICLLRFSHWEMMEEKIVQRLQTISMGQAAFKIELKDYGSYPSHSIFINLTTRQPVQALVKSIKNASPLLRMNSEHKPLFMEDPHILIASRLKPWQFEQGWLEYSHRQFTGRFIADSMLLLKRPLGERAPFQILRRFEFMNLPVETRQGSFFEFQQ
jgi:2'-5' RNA ligase